MESKKYIGISKTQSLRFKKNTYLLSMETDLDLVFGEKLTYGYLQNSFSFGTKRGWFVSKYSMTLKDFNNYWNLENGSIKVKLN